jgi:hypothetical protein
MCGSLIHRELMEPMLLEFYDDIREILGRVEWMNYVLRLQGYIDEIVLKLSMN